MSRLGWRKLLFRRQPIQSHRLRVRSRSSKIFISLIDGPSVIVDHAYAELSLHNSLLCGKPEPFLGLPDIVVVTRAFKWIWPSAVCAAASPPTASGVIMSIAAL